MKFTITIRFPRMGPIGPTNILTMPKTIKTNNVKRAWRSVTAWRDTFWDMKDANGNHPIELSAAIIDENGKKGN